MIEFKNIMVGILWWQTFPGTQFLYLDISYNIIVILILCLKMCNLYRRIILYFSNSI